jgi:hypothetical protein
MKTPNQIMSTMSNLPSAAPETLASIDSSSARVVNALFRELKAIFPAWKQAWPTAEDETSAKKSWVKAFVAARISQIEQIRFGIENCRKLGSSFIPSVGEFVAMCQPTPEMLGIPGHDQAYAEAIANAHPSMAGSREWSHQAVYHAASHCGFRSLSTMSAEASRKLFDRAYGITIRMLLAGEPLRSIPLGLPRPVARRGSETVGKEALALLRKNLGARGRG